VVRGSWLGVRGGVGGCGWWWEGSSGWFACWLWLAAAGGGRLATGKARGVFSTVARNGERGGGRGLLVLVVAGVGFCGRLMAWPVEVASLKARREGCPRRWRGMVSMVAVVGGCGDG